MLGGILSIVGLIALLALAGQALVAWLDRRKAQALIRDRLLSDYQYPPRPEPPHCLWPQLEPELELLRRKAAL